MNWQETLAQNQAVNKMQSNAPRGNDFTKYLPLIFNGNSPEGLAAIALVGDGLNSLFGGYKDRGYVRKARATADVLNSLRTARYGEAATPSIAEAIAQNVPAELGNGRTKGDPTGEFLNSKEQGNVAAANGDNWFANQDLGGTKKFVVDNLLSAKQDWANANASGNQAGMDAAAKKAEMFRNYAAQNGINLAGYGKDTSLDDFNLHYALDSRKTLDNLRNQMDSATYYNKFVEEGMKQGMSRRAAEQYAARYASEYQNDLMRQYQSAMNDYGLNGDGQLSNAGVELANMMSGEGGADRVKHILGSYLSPGKAAAQNALYSHQKDIARMNNDTKVLANALTNQARMAGINARYTNGGDGRGGKGKTAPTYLESAYKNIEKAMKRAGENKTDNFSAYNSDLINAAQKDAAGILRDMGIDPQNFKSPEEIDTYINILRGMNNYGADGVTKFLSEEILTAAREAELAKLNGGGTTSSDSDEEKKMPKMPINIGKSRARRISDDTDYQKVSQHVNQFKNQDREIGNDENLIEQGINSMGGRPLWNYWFNNPNATND